MGKQVENEKNYFKYLEVLNILAAFSVVVVHANGSFWAFANQPYWKLAIVIEMMGYWAVPAFFMITGATLMNYRQRYSTQVYFKKRGLRTLIPYIVWTVIGLIYKITCGEQTFSVFKLKNFLNSLLNAGGADYYWSFLPLFMIYLSLPVLSKFSEKERKNVFTYMIFFAFLTISVLPLLCKVLGIGYASYLTTPISGGFLLFSLLGYLAVYEWRFTGKQRLIIYFLGLLSWVISILGIYCMSVRVGHVDMTLGNYRSFSVIIFSFAVFTFVQYDLSNIKLIDAISTKWLRTISGASFGVYLIHAYPIEWIPQFFAFDSRSVLWRTVGALLVYILCVLVVLLLKKIPGLKRVVP